MSILHPSLLDEQAVGGSLEWVSSLTIGTLRLTGCQYISCNLCVDTAAYLDAICVNSAYSFPTAKGTQGQVLCQSGTNVVGWATPKTRSAIVSLTPGTRYAVTYVYCSYAITCAGLCTTAVHCGFVTCGQTTFVTSINFPAQTYTTANGISTLTFPTINVGRSLCLCCSYFICQAGCCSFLTCVNGYTANVLCSI